MKSRFQRTAAVGSVVVAMILVGTLAYREGNRDQKAEEAARLLAMDWESDELEHVLDSLDLSIPEGATLRMLELKVRKDLFRDGKIRVGFSITEDGPVIRGVFEPRKNAFVYTDRTLDRRTLGYVMDVEDAALGAMWVVQLCLLEQAMQAEEREVRGSKS